MTMVMGGVRCIVLRAKAALLRCVPSFARFVAYIKNTLFHYVAVFEAGSNAKRISPMLVRRFCFPSLRYGGFT